MPILIRGKDLHAAMQLDAASNTFVSCWNWVDAYLRAEHGEGSEQCRHHHRAFVTCANASTMMVVADLVKIADKRCPAEVEAYHRCKRGDPSSDCEEQDLAALRCASRSVLESAAAPQS